MRTGKKYWASGLVKVLFYSSDINKVIIGLIEAVGTSCDGAVKLLTFLLRNQNQHL